MDNSEARNRETTRSIAEKLYECHDIIIPSTMQPQNTVT